MTRQMDAPLPRLLLPLTIPASWLYRSTMAARNRRYDAAAAHRLRVPVISVGNITTGGVGKSPMVAWIARKLLDAGHRPAICMRGYGASRTQRSDEQMEHEAKLPNVPVIADPDRVTAAIAFLASHAEYDCLILDDGFQHRRLHRDLDLVLIDATRRTLQDRLLPAGYLREPLGSLRRADAVIMTHADAVDDALARAVAMHHGHQPLAWTQHNWRSLRVITGEGERDESLSWLKGKRLCTMLGVGNPRAVCDQLTNAGATLAADIVVRDHQRYDERILQRASDAAGQCDGLFVTAKDWVKLHCVMDMQSWPVPVIVPELQLHFVHGHDELASRIVQAANASDSPSTIG